MQDQSFEYFESNRPMETFLPVIKALIKTPKAFFEQMSPAYFFRDGIFFVSIIIFLATFVSMPFSNVLFLFLLPVTWGLLLVSLRFWSVYMAWAVRVFAKQKLSTRQAFQISTYAAFPMVFVAVPVLGVLASIWNLYLMWVGLVSYCKISGKNAAMIIMIPVIILLVSTVFLITLLIAVFPQLAGGLPH